MHIWSLWNRRKKPKEHLINSNGNSQPFFCLLVLIFLQSKGETSIWNNLFLPTLAPIRRSNCANCGLHNLSLTSALYEYPKMAPTTPRTAYNLYFRYYKNMFKNPSLRFKGITSNRNALKDFIRTVLNFDPKVMSVTDDSETRKYMGTKSFTGMSKKVGEEWKKVDELTRSVFKELAEEESERYKKASPLFA